MTFTRATYIGFVVGILLGALVMYAALASRTSSPVSKSNSAATTNTAADTSAQNALHSDGEGTQKGAYSLSVYDQPAGSTVTASFSLPEPAWVAIHDDDSGKLGRILGARLFPAGSSTSEVVLLRPTIPGSTYHAVLYADNGDHQFEYRVDPAISGPVGGFVESTFAATGGSASR